MNEAGKKGQVCVYSGENDIEYAKKVQTGDICGFFGPRRELHTYYGLQALYDFNHSTVVVDGLDKWGTPPIPAFYNVGDIWVDQTNIDEYAHRQVVGSSQDRSRAHCVPARSGSRPSEQIGERLARCTAASEQGPRRSAGGYP